MIRPDKQGAALGSLHFILIRARTMACEAGNQELAELLDAAEILPRYLLEDADLTERFRGAVQDIADRYACGHALHLFDDSLTAPAPTGSKKAS